jgi:hypothetical protein
VGFAAVGLLDNNNLTYNSTYTARITGSNETIVYIPVAAAGSHYVDVAYGKSGSTVSGDDRGYYRLLPGDDYTLNGGYSNVRLKPGRTVQIFVQNTGGSDRTITLPSDNRHILMSGTIKTLKANSWLEIHVTSMEDGKYNIRVGEAD